MPNSAQNPMPNSLLTDSQECEPPNYLASSFLRCLAAPTCGGSFLAANGWVHPVPNAPNIEQKFTSNSVESNRQRSQSMS
jgi:hypothetical protein